MTNQDTSRSQLPSLMKSSVPPKSKPLVFLGRFLGTRLCLCLGSLLATIGALTIKTSLLCFRKAIVLAPFWIHKDFILLTLQLSGKTFPGLDLPILRGGQGLYNLVLPERYCGNRYYIARSIKNRPACMHYISKSMHS